jgi:hypothetical protein
VNKFVGSVWDAVAGQATFDQFERTARELLQEFAQMQCVGRQLLLPTSDN